MADDLCGMEIGTPVYRCPNEDCSPDGWHKCMVPRGHETLHRCECGTMWVEPAYGPLIKYGPTTEEENQ